MKIDFANAFNCVERQAFLDQCSSHFPGLSQWAEWCYSRPSQLYFGSDTISSERGVQQGDPLGPLLFALALQPLLLQLNNGFSNQGLELAYSYLDDLILAGEQGAVAGAFHFFKAAALKIGLEFNTLNVRSSQYLDIMPHSIRICSPTMLYLERMGTLSYWVGPLAQTVFVTPTHKKG